MSTNTIIGDALGTFPKLRALIEYLDSLTERADLKVLDRLLSELEITAEDLRPALRFSLERYRRNTIRETDRYELVALCWKSGQRTPIHNHRESSCAFRVVEGDATETRFDRTPSGLICPALTRTLRPGHVCAAEDDDVHQVANAMPDGRELVTLHIYSPPLRRFHRYTLDSPTPEGQVELVEMNRDCAAAD